jgi:hypothetical protein
MKIFRLFTILSLSVLAVSLPVSCNHEKGYDYFLVKVDSIQFTNAAVANEPFDINFFGTIAGNGCFSFSNFNVRQDNSDIIIEAWGKAETNVSVCPTVMVYLTGHKVTHSVQYPGNYNIKVKQPDNSWLVRQIIVK